MKFMFTYFQAGMCSIHNFKTKKQHDMAVFTMQAARKKPHQKTSTCTSMEHPHTVDGRNPAKQVRLVVYPTMYQVSCIPGSAGCLPSTVVLDKSHQNYVDFQKIVCNGVYPYTTQVAFGRF